jgi:hypothetical protein
MASVDIDAWKAKKAAEKQAEYDAAHATGMTVDEALNSPDVSIRALAAKQAMKLRQADRQEASMHDDGEKEEPPSKTAEQASPDYHKWELEQGRRERVTDRAKAKDAAKREPVKPPMMATRQPGKDYGYPDWNEQQTTPADPSFQPTNPPAEDKQPASTPPAPADPPPRTTPPSDVKPVPAPPRNVPARNEPPPAPTRPIDRPANPPPATADSKPNAAPPPTPAQPPHAQGTEAPPQPQGGRGGGSQDLQTLMTKLDTMIALLTSIDKKVGGTPAR